MAFAVQTRELEGGIVVLRLSGKLDSDAVPELDQTVKSHVGAGRVMLVVDCEALESIHNDVLGVFLSNLVRVRTSGGDIKFCSMQPATREVVSVLGLTNLLKVYPDLAEAALDYRRKTTESEAPKKEEKNQKLKVESVQVKGVAVLRLTGFVDRHTIAILDKGLKLALDASEARAVVNCEGLTYISSNGLGVFLAFVQKARVRKGDVRFCAVKDMPLTSILISGLHNLFQIFESEEEAVDSFGQEKA